MADLISRESAKEAIRKKFQKVADRIEINEVLNSIPTIADIPSTKAYANLIDDCVNDLELQIDWIENIDGHQFPGWMNATTTMRRAIALLKGFSLYDT